MGQQFTNPGSALINPDGTVAAMGNPSRMRDADFKMSSQKHPYMPGTPDPNPPTPTAQTPSFAQAASYGATPGGANAASPGLTKGGKLATLLMSGLQGALAGRAKSEETVAATGGRRSGGAGMGFEAGYTLPWQRAGQQLGLEQQSANVQATQAQNQVINTPQGPMPAWLARYVAPAYIRGQAQQNVAQTGAQSRENVAQIGAQSRENVAGINKRYQIVPNVGLFDTQTRQLVPQTEQGITITPEIAKDHNLPAEFIGKPMSLQNLASIQRSDVFQDVPEMTAQGPIIINRKTSQATPVTGPGGARYSPPALASPVQVVNPSNPGAVTYAPAGTAISQGLQSPQSATTKAAQTEAKSEVPTQIGNQKVAFNTALQHADLLQKALTALNNGDQRTINSLKNAFKTEFGSSDVTNFQVISNAYAREISKMLASGHMTDSEIASAGGTLPANASPQQILGALNSYRALAQSKLNMLNQQANSATRSNAAPQRPKGVPSDAIWNPQTRHWEK